MRNFHRDFESLNEAYNKQVQRPCTCTLNESTTDEIASMHRENSLKTLREALKKLAKAHHEDYSSVTMEEVYNEMKMFANENLTPAEPETTVPPVAALAGSLGSNHQQTPVTGIAQENQKPVLKPKDKNARMYNAEEGTDGETDDLTEFEKQRLKKHLGKEQVEETVGIRAARTDEENFEADRKAAGLKKQGEIMKKDLEDEEKEAKGKKIDEDFEKMLSVMKAADQVQSESGCGTHSEDDEDPTDDAEEKDVEEGSTGLEESPATMSYGASQNAAAFDKGLDAALAVAAKHNDKSMLGKLGAAGSGSKKVADGVNKYMSALSNKLSDMAEDLQGK